MDFIPWNENFMIAGALLALLADHVYFDRCYIRVCINKKTAYRNAVVFSIGTIALFLAVMMDIYIC